MAEVESSLAAGGGEVGGVCEGSDGADGGACVCRSQRKATIKTTTAPARAASK